MSNKTVIEERGGDREKREIVREALMDFVRGLPRKLRGPPDEEGNEGDSGVQDVPEKWKLGKEDVNLAMRDVRLIRVLQRGAKGENEGTVIAEAVTVLKRKLIGATVSHIDKLRGELFIC